MREPPRVHELQLLAAQQRAADARDVDGGAAAEELRRHSFPVHRDRVLYLLRTNLLKLCDLCVGGVIDVWFLLEEWKGYQYV